MVPNNVNSLGKVSGHATLGSEVLSPRRHTKHCRLAILILTWLNPSLINHNGRTGVNGTGNTNHHAHCPHGHIWEAWQRTRPLAHLLPSEDSNTTILNVRQVLSRDIERRGLEIYAVQRRGRKCYKHLELLSTSPINLVKLSPSWKTLGTFSQGSLQGH